MELNIGLEEEPDSLDEDISNILPSIFSNTSAFPKLMDLHLDVSERRANTTSRPFSLPFCNLAKVTSLSLKTNGTILAPIPDGRCLPALRSLELKSCERLASDWIALFLGRLSAQGNLQPSQLTVEGCQWRRSPVISAPDSGEDSDYVDVTADEMLQLVQVM